MNKGRRKFNAAFKAKVAVEALKEQLILAELAEKYDLHPTQITEWKKQLLSGSEQVFDQGKKADSEATEHQEEKDELYKQIGQLKVENDWLKKNLNRSLGRTGRMAIVSRDDTKLSIVRQCQLLEVSRSSHYHEPKGESKQNLELMAQIDRLHLEHPYFGAVRMAKHLSTDDLVVNVKRIRRLMRKMDISAIYPVPNTSEACKYHKKYPYLLKGLNIDRNNQVWSMDITYIPMAKGFMYLCAIIDWQSRYLLSWTLSNTMTVDFCLEALQKAVSMYGTLEILNTDQGSQFTSEEFTSAVLNAEIKISMDGVRRAQIIFALSDFGAVSNTRIFISMLTTVHWNYTKVFTGMWNSTTGNENIKAWNM